MMLCTVKPVFAVHADTHMQAQLTATLAGICSPVVVLSMPGEHTWGIVVQPGDVV